MKLNMAAVGFLLTVAPMAAFSLPGAESGKQGPDPALIYPALSVPEFRVVFLDPETGTPRVGTNVFETSVGGLLCRRTAPVIPNPSFDYTCYVERKISDGKAMVLFYLLNVPPVQVRYLDPETGAPRVGVTILEKEKGGLLCQRIAAVVPDPVPRYTCYRDMALDAKELGNIQGRIRSEEHRGGDDLRDHDKSPDTVHFD
jgi:hypothetical protein